MLGKQKLCIISLELRDHLGEFWVRRVESDIASEHAIAAYASRILETAPYVKAPPTLFLY
jgi:hypothetical protein